MKQQKTVKNTKLWLIIAIAVVVVGAAVAALLLGGFGQEQTQTQSLTADGKVYWNIDRMQYVKHAETDPDKLHTTRPLRDGHYIVRMAVDGEQVDLKVRDMVTVQKMDNRNVMCLVFDSEGYVVDMLDVDDVKPKLIEDVYVQSIDGNTVAVNTSPNYIALKHTFEISEDTAVYNVANYDGSGLFTGLPGKLSLDDNVWVVLDENNVATHIFSSPYHTPGDVYYNLERMYDSTLKMTTRQPDSLGYYNYEFSLNGQMVKHRTKDQAVANSIDSQSYQWVGLEFNDDGDISAVITASKAVYGSGACLNTNIREILEIDGVTTIRCIAQSNRVSSQGRLHPDCKIYDFSGSSEYLGQPTQIREGDYVRCLKDAYGRLAYIAVVHRPDVYKYAYVLDRQYDSETKTTARTADGYGYYHIKVTIDNKEVTLRCNNKRIVNYIDSQTTKIVALLLKDDVILEAVSASYGMAGYYLASGWDVTAVDFEAGTIEITCMSGNDKGTVKKGVLSENLKTFNVSSMADKVGQFDKVQVGDTVRAYLNYKGEVEMIYVTTRPFNSRVYRKLESKGLQEDGYYHFRMAVDGKQIWVKAKDAKVLDRLKASTTVGLLMTSDNVVYKAASAVEVLGCNGGLFGNGATYGYISDGQINVYKDGKTLTATLASNYKIYDVSTKGSRAGLPTTLRSGDIVQCFKNKAAEVTLIYVTGRDAHYVENHCACYGSEHVADHSACEKLSWKKIPEIVDNKINITESGNYYLNSDKAASLIIPEGVTVNLCLNGFAFRGNRPITVNEGAVLNISDCTGEGLITSTNSINDGYALRTAGGVVNLYSGTITGTRPDVAKHLNRSVQILRGEFNMYGGTIRDGVVTGTKNGANVQVMDGTTFRMLGGTVSGGTVENGKGTGVYVDNGGIMILGGSAKIDELYLTKKAQFSFDQTLDATKANVTVALAENAMDIGTGTAKEEYTKAIISQDKGFVTAYDAKVQALYLKLAATDGHIHCLCNGDEDDCNHRVALFATALTQDMFTKADGVVSTTVYKHNNAKVNRDAYTLAAGTYYLTEDITLDKEIYLKNAHVTICLNGHKITSQSSFAIIGTGVNLTICDHENKGAIIGKGIEGHEAGVIWHESQNSTVNIYGGTLTLAQDHNKITNGGIIASNGALNIYGGIITGGNVTGNGGNIKMGANNNAVLTMYGGTVSNGTATEGGNITGRAAAGISQLNLLGGTVSGGTAPKGADVHVGGKITLGNTQLGDIYLNKGISIALSHDFDATKTSVAVAAADAATPVVTGLTAEQAKAFTSSNTDFVISYNSKTQELYLVAAKHVHCTCEGAEHVADHTACQQVEWKEIPAAVDNVTTIPGSGHYYLTAGVVGSLKFTIPEGQTSTTVDLCLNGHYIRGNQPIIVTEGVTLNICDCDGEGYITSTNSTNDGFAIRVNRGIVNLYGGTITGTRPDATSQKNRAVQVMRGSFNMFGGTIRDGVVTGSAKNGANVLVMDGSSFTMVGGTITGGSSENLGSGVYVTLGAQITLGGTAKITGNADTDLYLPADVVVTMSSEYPLTDGADIRLDKRSAGLVISGITAEQAECFTVKQGKLVYDGSADPTSLFYELVHEHCICTGAEHVADHTACTKVKWTAAPAAVGNVTTLVGGGHYYLTGNVVGSLKFTIPEGQTSTTVDLCLNGYYIRGNTPISASAGVTLNICDCDGEGYITSTNSTNTGYGIRADGGTVNFYSGTVCGINPASPNSHKNRAVQVMSGNFNMFGGTIRDGYLKNTKNGAGVLVMNGGSFTMVGGTVTGNTLQTGKGTGVYVDNGGQITLGGTAKITGNTGSDLYLPTGITAAISAEYPLTQGANIGITLGGTTGDVATGVTSDISGYFKSNVADHTVAYEETDSKLVVKANVPATPPIVPGAPITLKYDDRKEIADLVGAAPTQVSITNEVVTSKQVGTSTADTNVLKYENGVLYAVGTGTATLTVDGTEYPVTVEKAKLSLFLITGHSIAAGARGDADQSVVVEAGQGYSTFFGQSGGSAQLDVAASAATVAGGIGYGSAERVANIDAFAPGQGGNLGEGSGLAYQWNKLTGEKAWVINVARGGTCINQWVPGEYNHQLALAVFNNAQDVAKAEFAAGHYELGEMAVIYHNAANFDQYPGFTEQSMLTCYEQLWNSFKQNFNEDLDGDSAVDTVSLGLVPLWSESGRNSMTNDKPLGYYLAATNEDIFVASHIYRQWMTVEGLASFPTPNYTTQSEPVAVPESVQHTAQGGTSDNSVFCKEDKTHLQQVVYNAIGMDLAKNLEACLRDGRTATGANLYDVEYRQLTGTVDMLVDETMLIVPVAEPVYAGGLTVEVSGAVSQQSTGWVIKADTAGTGKITLKKGSEVLGEVEVNVAASAAHSHCVCVGSEAKPAGHTCTQTAWQPAPTKASNKITFTESGSYYLPGDEVTASLAFSIPSGQTAIEVNLCLNGSLLHANTTVDLPDNVTLRICDCTGSGQIKSHAGENSGFVLRSRNAGNTVELYSGSMGGKHGGKNNRTIQMSEGTFKMYGGTIHNGSTPDNGGNILLTSGNPSFYMYGGTISNGATTGSSKRGGNVYIDAGQFIMEGGTISGGTSANHGGNICVLNGSFTMKNGTITGGVAAAKGGNVMLLTAGASHVAEFTMEGGTITGGLTEEGKVNGTYGGNVCVNPTAGKATFTITGGTVTGGRSSNNGAGVFVFNNAGAMVVVGGTANITGNTHNGAPSDLFLSQNRTVTFSTEKPLDTDNSDGKIARIGICMSTPNVFATASNEATALLYKDCFFSNLTESPNITVDGSSLKLGA